MSSDDIPMLTTPTVNNDNIMTAHPYLSDIRAEYCKIMKAINLLKDEEIGFFTEGQITDNLEEVPNSQLVKYLTGILYSAQTLYLAEYFTDTSAFPKDFGHTEKRIKTEHLEEARHAEVFYPAASFDEIMPPTMANINMYDTFERDNIDSEDILLPNMSESEEQTKSQYLKYSVIYCKYCDYTAETQASLGKHIQECHPELIQCGKCNFTATLPQSITLHETVHETKRGEAFCCTICKYQTKVRFNFNEHVFVHTGDKSYPCQHCDKHFSSYTRYSRHFKDHHQHLILKCDNCDFSTHFRAALKKHIDKFHLVKPRPKTLLCEECTFIATIPRSMELHRAVHNKEKKIPGYFCTICDYRAATSANFNYHILAHTKDKPFACGKCNASFASTYNLTRHVKKLHPFDFITPISMVAPIARNV